MKILFKNRVMWVLTAAVFLVMTALLYVRAEWNLWLSAGLSAFLVVGTVACSGWLRDNYLTDEPVDDDLSRRLDAIDKKLDEIRRGPVTHQIIINSISDLSNDELRKILSVQKDLNAG